MTDNIGYILIMVGILFDIFGCIGLVRFPDLYNRLQASTKCVTLGTILLLVGVAVVSASGPTIAKVIVCAVFTLITSPTAAHAIAKGAYASGVALWENSVVDKYAESKFEIRNAKYEGPRFAGTQTNTNDQNTKSETN